MSCLKSFTLNARGNLNNAASSHFWTQNGNNYFSLDRNFSSSYIVEGFKNINIYGVEMVGAITSNGMQPDHANFLNYGVELQLNGLIPQVSGRINAAPNQWNLDNTTTFARIINLNKYTNKITFASPFESVKNINFLKIQVSGDGAFVPATISLVFELQFVFYYKYEGE